MTHLVPVPPPVNYQNPTLTRFSIAAPDGVGKILAWGCTPGKAWRVGTDFADEVFSEQYSSPYPDLTYFYLKGARQGMKLAVFVWQDDKWIRYSEYVEVASNLGDSWVAAAAAGTLTKSSYNSHISFYPFGAPQGNPSMSESEWINKIEEALGTINRNVIGRTVLKNIKKDITIHPFLPPYPNAYSSVLINPNQWTTNFWPCGRADEILLHELIHVIENNANVYQNRYGFSFDSTDFLTVNATNVYSCMLGRALRKDHHGFEHLPDEHFRNPKLHWEQQSPNYWAASGTAGDLVRTLAAVEDVWNPFFYWSEAFEVMWLGH